MALIFECIQTEGIAALSYLLGDTAEGVAAVFDPRPDVDCYLQLARAKQLAITHIFETHIHVDFVSGARELGARAESAKIFLSHEGGAQYGFDHEVIKDGDIFRFGSLLLTVKHAPGHTPELVAFLLADDKRRYYPWGVLTGDSLFVNSVGRPDLLGSEHDKILAGQLFHTIHDFYLKLADYVIIYPAHGQGSPCGVNIGDRRHSTIGYERRFNPLLQFDEEDGFIDYVLSTAPPMPAYYPRLKQLNTNGPAVLGRLPAIRALPAPLFQQALANEDNILIDTRMMLAFGGGHIHGALNIGGSPLLSLWAGWLLDPARPLLLVLEADDRLEKIIRLLLRTGYSKFAGYLVGGMQAWDNAGLPLAQIGQMTVQAIRNAGGNLQLLDVRTPSEWQEGHIPQARHIFLGQLPEHLDSLDKTRPTAVYCDNGYRASLATSILQKEGFGCVCNVPGSWQAWVAAGFPVAREPAAEETSPQRQLPADDQLVFKHSAFFIGCFALLCILYTIAEAATGMEAGDYSRAAWSPYVVGTGIGVLSWLTFYFADKPIGVSSFYAQLAGFLGKLIAPRHTASLTYFIDNPPQVDWKFVFVVATIGGGTIAALTGGEFVNQWLPSMWTARFGDSTLLRALVAFAGGLLMAFGARLAGGCTSGHGISGTLQLNLASWIAVICFFIGGITIARLLFTL